jgi:hypothetical protein
MGTLLLRRLLLLLTALAFVLAGALPGSALAMPMPGGAMVAGSSGHPCDNCPDEAHSGQPAAKIMPCGALACAGVVAALPTPVAPAVPFFAVVRYPAQASTDQTSVALPPDPFPPRPVFLV